MESSDTHGPRLDDALARETRSLTTGSPVESRAEAARTMQEGADDEPTPEAIVHALPDDDPPRLAREEVRSRSVLAIHLRPSLFPATRDEVVECATELHAPPDLLERLRALPDATFANVEGVWKAMGGRREARDTTPDATATTETSAAGSEP